MILLVNGEPLGRERVNNVKNYVPINWLRSWHFDCISFLSDSGLCWKSKFCWLLPNQFLCFTCFINKKSLLTLERRWHQRWGWNSLFCDLLYTPNDKPMIITIFFLILTLFSYWRPTCVTVILCFYTTRYALSGFTAYMYYRLRKSPKMNVS